MNTWMAKYYGKEWMAKLQPKLVYDGKNKAIVRVTTNGSSGYVLVQKNGAHGVTPHEVLYLGIPGPTDFTKMHKRLVDADPA